MGYYILGVIILLLLIVFISDLIREARDKEDIEDFDTEEYFNFLQSQYPGKLGYREEFGKEDDDKNGYRK
ncbi:MAG TPA: hypothetical protein VIK84_02555 [Haloplasmataceae bacterium]